MEESPGRLASGCWSRPIGAAQGPPYDQERNCAGRGVDDAGPQDLPEGRVAASPDRAPLPPHDPTTAFP
eukprot:9165377-Pyramimonas_sp.AAC.1